MPSTLGGCPVLGAPQGDCPDARGLRSCDEANLTPGGYCVGVVGSSATCEDMPVSACPVFISTDRRRLDDGSSDSFIFLVQGSQHPTPEPTSGPSPAPSQGPTLVPSEAPTATTSTTTTAVPQPPTSAPVLSEAPTVTAAPTRTDTYAPTRTTEAPSYAPTTDTYVPTTTPTATGAPTASTVPTTPKSPQPTPKGIRRLRGLGVDGQE